MLFRLYLLIAVVFIAFFFYLFSLNPQTVSIKLSATALKQFPLIPFLFLVLIAGFILNYLLSLPKNGKRFVENLRLSKQRKIDEEVEKQLSTAKKFILLDKWKSAEPLLKKCIAFKPESVEAYIILLDYYVKINEQDKVFDIIDNLPSSIDKHLGILVPKARILMAKGSYDRAADIIKMIKEHEGDVDTNQLLRDMYIQSSQWEKASELHERIVKDLKKGERAKEELLSARINHELAKMSIEEGKHEDALKKFTELTKKQGEFAPPYVNLGKLHWEMGNRELAVQTLKKGYTKTNNLIFIFMLEELYLNEEDPQEIINIYKDLTNEQPDNAYLKLFFGKLYLRLEMREEALLWLKKAEASDIKTPYIPKLLGEVLFRDREFKEAAEKFKEALGHERRILIPFVCTSCCSQSNEWKGICPNCSEWDTLKVALT